ncbi:MAG: MOSC domain-containing protein [Rectinemataceae bacterium]|jgi:MOSC domain-containing protein YiiM
MAAIAREGEFEIVSLNVSEKKGTRKRPIPRARFAVGLGVEGDAHAGLLEDRQVSLLAIEEIEGASAACVKAAPGAAALVPGDFAENVTTKGIVLHELPLGTRLYIGTAELELSKIGKQCHADCEIKRLVGECVMPSRGVFARVLRAGEAGNADRCRYRIG